MTVDRILRRNLWSGREVAVMTTPRTETVPAAIPARRAPTRLSMSEHPGTDALDGGWWPRSRDPEVEIGLLVADFPASVGRITRVLYSPPDWDSAPRSVAVPGGRVKAGFFPRDDTHLVLLSTSDREVLRILVVPSDFTEAQGAEAMLAAATAGNAHTGNELLATVTDSPDHDPDGVWDHAQ